ncbi:MAG: hypothetical protein GY716_05685 [bacterium]|nr:hypothetical protein [bacterium]
MSKKLWLNCLLLIAALALAPAWAEEPAQRTTAEIRINLPTGVPPVVSVSPGKDRIEVDLPSGSVFPGDFAAASGGLLAGATVTENGSRVHLSLETGLGALQRVVYDPEGIVLRLENRFARADSGIDVYRLGPYDRIHFKVHNHPELATTLSINENGMITAPLVGEVSAVGLSTAELATRVEYELSAEYIRDPQVDIEVETYRSQWVMVAGEVLRPGRIPLRGGGTRLKEILAESEGFTEKAGEEIRISRKADDGEDYTVFTYDRLAFENGETNPAVGHGDIVEVTRAEYCYVQGEVRSPTRVRIERNMTLLKAITLVEGLTDWADRKAVRILSGEGPSAKVRVVNLVKIQKGKEVDPILTGGEIIHVQRRFF